MMKSLTQNEKVQQTFVISLGSHFISYSEMAFFMLKIGLLRCFFRGISMIKALKMVNCNLFIQKI